MFNFDEINNKFNLILATNMVAKVQRMYYESLVAEGFSEEESLHLVDLMSGCLVQGIAYFLPSLMNNSEE